MLCCASRMQKKKNTHDVNIFIVHFEKENLSTLARNRLQKKNTSIGQSEGKMKARVDKV